MRNLIVALTVFLSGLSHSFAAAKKVCPALIDLAVAYDGQRPQAPRQVPFNSEVNWPHRSLERMGESDARNTDSGYGPHFDEGGGRGDSGI